MNGLRRMKSVKSNIFQRVDLVFDEAVEATVRMCPACAQTKTHEMRYISGSKVDNGASA